MESKNVGTAKTGRHISIQSIIIFIVSLDFFCGGKMIKDYSIDFEILANRNLPEKTRMVAATKIGNLKNKEAIPGLKLFLSRPRPQGKFVDYDPLAAERLCDIAVVNALHMLGDTTQVRFLFNAVENAAQGLGQPIKETKEAALTINTIGNVSLIERLIKMTATLSKQPLANCIQTLVMLDLPERPVYQMYKDLKGVEDVFKITPRNLADFFKDVSRNTNGLIAISKNLINDLEADNYVIAEGEPEETSADEIISGELGIYNIAYYIDKHKIMLCTQEEAALLWQKWWEINEKLLAYDHTKCRFVLRK
jgi:hypothetical protein